MAGSPLGEAAEAAVAAAARARPGVSLRPFSPFSGAAEADEGSGDWSFIDCEMEEVDLQDLPSATIACHLDPRVFVDGLCRVRAGSRGPSGGGRTLVARRRWRAGGSAEVPAGPGKPLQPGLAEGRGGDPPGTWRHPLLTPPAPAEVGSRSPRVPRSRAPVGPRRSQLTGFPAPRLGPGLGNRLPATPLRPGETE